MRLSDEAHAKIERFFREHRGDAGLVLPRIRFHCGLAGRLVMGAVGMSGMTLGRHVFVRPSFLMRDAEGRPTLPGWLVVHEAAHVLQYEERGFLRFLLDYARSYLRGLRGWGRGGRRAAYMSIPEEREARAAERAYHSWLERAA